MKVWEVEKTININTILERVERVEKELEELKIELLKLQVEQLPAEEVDEETLKDLEKRFKEYKEGKAKVISADKARKRLLALLEDV